MQFTVLIEFLIPGLLTTIAFLLLVFGSQLPPLPASVPGGDSTSVLLLLAISYPVGILVNFPIFKILQDHWLLPRAKREVLKEFREQGLDLVKIASHFFRLEFNEEKREDLSHLWRFLRAAALSRNFERLTANYLYHEGLQRFSRGMLLPLLLGVLLVLRDAEGRHFWLAIVLVCMFLGLSLWLLIHSLKIENDQIARYFLMGQEMFDSIEAGRFRNTVAVDPNPSPSTA